MLKHFNDALNAMRGDATEQELARRLGISDDVLLKYRRGEFPKNVRRLAAHPDLLAALALDAETTEANDVER